VVPQVLDFDIEATRASLARLRQENQRLKLQLQASQQAPAAPAPLLGDDQQWFVTGAAVGVISFILGLLLTRGRRRREWLN
jgi:molecular chaperone DnaK (HSP70)